MMTGINDGALNGLGCGLDTEFKISKGSRGLRETVGDVKITLRILLLQKIRYNRLGESRNQETGTWLKSTIKEQSMSWGNESKSSYLSLEVATSNEKES